MLKKIFIILLFFVSNQSHASYVWMSLVCGSKFVQLVDTNSTDATYEGIIINDEVYSDATKLEHSVENGATTTTFIAKNFSTGKMVAVSHIGYSRITAYVEYDINSNGQIVGDYTYGSQCRE